eukprot:m.300153 g.300153  ORF g.300153 m.300153 type:complete len:720 (-) comp14359_c0_seq1:110-2269(-)
MTDLRSLFSIPSDCPVQLLDCRDAFGPLSAQERLYAHHIARAGFEGAKICLLQCSHEAVPVFTLLRLVFDDKAGSVADAVAAAAAAGVAQEDIDAILMYTAAFFTNYGNYLSFGDSKFVPRTDEATMLKFIQAVPAYKMHATQIDELWGATSQLIFSLDKKLQTLGLGEDGVSTYYSANCTKEDAEAVQEFMTERNIHGENTRVFKLVSGDSYEYILRIAASTVKQEVFVDESRRWRKVTVFSGDFAPLMQRVINHLESALQFAANENQRDMLTMYIESFKTGSIDDHKKGSRSWIHDKGPIVESYIGFIETYRDPFGVRAEWEGFAAVVNKEISAKFGLLVESAEKLIEKLPWPTAFEKDRFLRPDFTSLEIVGFGSSGVPAGINIPNYGDIRQDDGFKNVSLGNVLRAKMTFPKDKPVYFVAPSEMDLYRNTAAQSFDVQVGLHELLGHGSGKLFYLKEDGSHNFATDTINPVTQAQVASFYKPGETYDSKFGNIGSSYEECRAECVGLYLCTDPDVLKIYGIDEQRGEEVAYINWLNMVRAGVLALQYFTPGKGSAGWGQAHMMARYAILRVLLEAGEDFVTIVRGNPSQESGEGTYVSLDRTKIATVGMTAIGAYLQKLNVFKATADIAGARAMYEKYTAVEGDMLTLRDEVIENRQPRSMLVQCNTSIVENDVNLKAYEASASGIIESFCERYPSLDAELLVLWEEERSFTSPL